MDKLFAKKILDEAQKRIQRKDSLDPNEILFGPQLTFVLDESKNKAALCSRRAGKSYGVAFLLLKAAFHYPKSICPYITLTRDTAKLILWPALMDLDTKYNLSLKFRENTGDVVLPNKSKIIIRGADDPRQIEKLRGPKYPIAVVDEAQGFPSYLKNLIWDVLEPATLDYEGQIVLCGTPNAACAGPFYEITNGKVAGWKVHHWTLRQNPHLPNVKGYLKRLKDNNGWDSNHPTYLREYCGKWVRDENNLVFSYDEDRNTIPSFDPEGAQDYDYILGIDLGFNDPTAFVTVAASRSLGQCFVVESYKESGLIPSVVAARVESLMGRYPYTRIVADTGGFGKGYAEEMKQKFHIPVIAANKVNKLTFIEMLNGDLRSGVLKLAKDRNEDLIEEISLLQWDENKIGYNKFIFDRNFQDHLSDAFLYAWREGFHHHLDFEREQPKFGTRPYWQKEAQKMEDADVERHNSKNDPENQWWLKI